ncbi:hypothetical protein FB451DRAFT_1373004 [Mycena latifolia]|nr:hypothetical protein FB451DRAFT_1373004 [Mycena latifolia]
MHVLRTKERPATSLVVEGVIRYIGVWYRRGEHSTMTKSSGTKPPPINIIHPKRFESGERLQHNLGSYGDHLSLWFVTGLDIDHERLEMRRMDDAGEKVRSDEEDVAVRGSAAQEIAGGLCREGELECAQHRPGGAKTVVQVIPVRAQNECERCQRQRWVGTHDIPDHWLVKHGEVEVEGVQRGCQRELEFKLLERAERRKEAGSAPMPEEKRMGRLDANHVWDTSPQIPRLDELGRKVGEVVDETHETNERRRQAPAPKPRSRRRRVGT